MPTDKCDTIKKIRWAKMIYCDDCQNATFLLQGRINVEADKFGFIIYECPHCGRLQKEYIPLSSVTHYGG